jgi:hypothetical protein
VKRERLELLLENSLHTQRFARYVGQRCRSGTIKDVAAELHLDWHTVKRLEKQYMRDQLQRGGKPRPKVIGLDEVSVRKDTSTASSSAIWKNTARSGSGARIAARRAWMSSIAFSGKRRLERSVWP